MKYKLLNSIKPIIIGSTFLLAILTIISSALSRMHLGQVNKKATNIIDYQVAQINLLKDIRKDIESIHKQALSHIISIDLNDMLSIAVTIREGYTQIDNDLMEYENYLGQEDSSTFQSLTQNIEEFEKVLANLLAYSARNQVEKAYAWANNELSHAADVIYFQITEMLESVQGNLEDAKVELYSIYKKSLFTNTIYIISTIAIILAVLYLTFTRIILPISKMKNEISKIIYGIEEREGDLTQRITIKHKDEIATLGNGINAFIEKLQHILSIISKESNKMKDIGMQVLQNVSTSRDNVTDLSALMEELTVTMEEVRNNSETVNKSAISINADIEAINDKMNEISTYSVEMKRNASQLEKEAQSNSIQIHSKVYEILDDLTKAIEDCENIKYINDLTNEIIGISKQTNLLAINASIEASRAGESGKGFAVVAEEIRRLADSSRDSANNIQTANELVTSAVQNLSSHSDALIKYLQQIIIPEFTSIVEASNQYKQDADYIEATVKSISNSTDSLKDIAFNVTNAITSITYAISESSRGIGEAATNMQNIVMEVNNIASLTDENHEIADSLQAETKIFTKL